MIFRCACESLQDGRKVRRMNFHTFPPGTYLEFNKNGELYKYEDLPSNNTNTYRTAKQYTLTREDLEANDWEEYKPESKYVTYDVAFKAARETGCKIKYHKFENGNYMRFCDGTLTYFWKCGNTPFTTYDYHMDGECWEILEE